MQDLNIINESYLIIGGPNTNKSNVSRELSKRLGLKLINLDREKHSYFDDFTDYDFKKYQNILEKFGYKKALGYIHKYEMKHLNYVLDTIEFVSVIDFGNTYLIVDDEIILNKIKSFKNIVLLDIDDDKKIINDGINYKLYNNKILNDIQTIKINISNKKALQIVDEIINYKKYKDIL